MRIAFVWTNPSEEDIEGLPERDLFLSPTSEQQRSHQSEGEAIPLWTIYRSDAMCSEGCAIWFIADLPSCPGLEFQVLGPDGIEEIPVVYEVITIAYPGEPNGIVYECRCRC